MPHHEDPTKMIGKVLGNMIAIQETIVDADTKLAGGLEIVGGVQFDELKQYFREFESEDRKYLENFREVAKAFGVGEVGPDEFTQNLIGLCKNAFVDTNIPGGQKVGCYTMLLTAVKQGSYLLTNVGAVQGKEELGCRMSAVFQGVYSHSEALSSVVHRKVKEMAKSFQPVEATTGATVGQVPL